MDKEDAMNIHAQLCRIADALEHLGTAVSPEFKDHDASVRVKNV
jgi:hypothetical protein